MRVSKVEFVLSANLRIVRGYMAPKTKSQLVHWRRLTCRCAWNPDLAWCWYWQIARQTASVADSS